jgi:hypothetical protein
LYAPVAASAGARSICGASSWKRWSAASLNEATMIPSRRPIRLRNAASASALRRKESASLSAAPLISMLIGTPG